MWFFLDASRHRMLAVAAAAAAFHNYVGEIVCNLAIYEPWGWHTAWFCNLKKKYVLHVSPVLETMHTFAVDSEPDYERMLWPTEEQMMVLETMSSSLSPQNCNSTLTRIMSCSSSPPPLGISHVSCNPSAICWRLIPVNKSPPSLISPTARVTDYSHSCGCLHFSPKELCGLI